MKTVKDILISVLIMVTISFYLGHDIINCYAQHMTYTEQTTNNDKSQNLISSESSFEEESSVVFPESVSCIIRITKEKFIPETFLYPHKLSYSIWLPPDIV